MFLWVTSGASWPRREQHKRLTWAPKGSGLRSAAIRGTSASGVNPGLHCTDAFTGHNLFEIPNAFTQYIVRKQTVYSAAD